MGACLYGGVCLERGVWCDTVCPEGVDGGGVTLCVSGWRGVCGVTLCVWMEGCVV